MRARRDGSNEMSNRHQRRFRPMIAAGIPGHWYDRLNEIGPEPGLVPFVDDDPPFHLQRPSSDEGSAQAFQDEPVSSRFGGNSQPQPLSHSLLSRLELSENDPNTFRDIIDDLTVLNRNLKRQLKRYEKTHSISKEHNGLFEVRIHSLPPDKKHELEVILHNFTATIHSAQPKSSSRLATRRQSLHQSSDRVSDRSSPSHPSVQALDSAYESISATGVTVPTVPSVSTRPGTVLYQKVHGNTFPAASSVPQPSGDAMIPDREKRESIVRKLEEIFENDLGAFGQSNEATKSLKSVQHRPLVASTAPVVDETSARPLDESVSSSAENIESAGAQSDHRLQQEKFLLRQNEANQNKQRYSPSQVRHLRYPGVTSPIAEPGPQASPEWIYLNLLVNMAQLHTLNVTPDFVRKAIHDCSTKLVLSDDGCKVRWRGHSEQTGPGPDELYKSAATPLANSPASSPMKRLEQDGRGPSRGRDSAQEYSTSYLQDTTPSGRHQSSILNIATDSKLQYRPMFAPRKRRSLRSHHDAKDDRSVDSDSTSSSMDSCPAQTKMDNQSGPMIFLDSDPFFLDLSADFPDSDRLDRKLYGRLVEQPLGRHNGSTELYPETEKRSQYALPTASGETPRHGNSLHESIPFPSLTIYDDDPANPPEDSTTGAEPVELAASGIGGIQLDDNFAIDVKTEQQPPPSLSVPPYEDGREWQTRARVSTHVLPTHPPVPAAHHRHLLSATTRHLPPSPLPPPSYVYPAFSSSSASSDCESDEDILHDVDSDSELEFRPLSLSPQMRMFLEGEEQASAPEEEDEDMDVEEED
ncbi:hypothetical protein XANCAGTX0491_006194 [Xanthoria calcicola]